MQLENANGLPEGVYGWLCRVGWCDMTNFPYYVPSTGMHYSDEYLKKTPLEELKFKHRKNLERKTDTTKNKHSVMEIIVPCLVSSVVAVAITLLLV